MPKIAWTNKTWNPVIGCRRVSDGCKKCYAELQAKRVVAMQRARGRVSPYEDVVKMDEDGNPTARWNGKAVFVKSRLGKPLSWQKPARVFVNSMSDLFHEDISFEHVAAIFGVMAAATKHTFQVLTKRPARMVEFFRWVDEQGEELQAAVGIDPANGPQSGVCALMSRGVMGLKVLSTSRLEPAFDAPWPLSNVWLGVSIEDQATADERIPLLLECPASVRWVSYEPALQPVDFDRWSVFPLSSDAEEHIPWLNQPDDEVLPAPNGGLDWVVVGGESGPKARPFDLAWASSVIDQCKDTGVACFIKQLGSAPYEERPALGGPQGTTEALLDWGEEHPQQAWFDADSEHWTLTHFPDGRSAWMRHLNLISRKGDFIHEWPEHLRVREFPT